MLQKQITEFEVETVDLLLRLVSYDRHKKSNVIVLANDNSDIDYRFNLGGLGT